MFKTIVVFYEYKFNIYIIYNYVLDPTQYMLYDYSILLTNNLINNNICYCLYICIIENNKIKLVSKQINNLKY